MIQTRTASATARHAGANIVHTVYVDGEVVGTRRSAHRYLFAICRWVGKQGTPERTVVVVRWSRSNKCSSGQFALYAEMI
jgi:hypothetical protein